MVDPLFKTVVARLLGIEGLAEGVVTLLGGGGRLVERGHADILDVRERDLFDQVLQLLFRLALLLGPDLVASEHVAVVEEDVLELIGLRHLQGVFFHLVIIFKWAGPLGL